MLLVLSIVFMFASVGFSEHDFVEKDFSKKENQNSHDMSAGMSTSKPQVQSNNGACIGPYSYEQLNQNTQSIIDEWAELNGATKFCDHTIEGVEFKVVPYLFDITLNEDLRDLLGKVSNDPQKNAKLKMYFNGEIMKYQMFMRVMNSTLQKTDRRRYYMWLDSQQKVKRALRANPTYRKILKKTYNDVRDSVR